MAVVIGYRITIRNAEGQCKAVEWPLSIDPYTQVAKYRMLGFVVLRLEKVSLLYEDISLYEEMSTLEEG